MVGEFFKTYPFFVESQKLVSRDLVTFFLEVKRLELGRRQLIRDSLKFYSLILIWEQQHAFLSRRFITYRGLSLNLGLQGSSQNENAYIQKWPVLLSVKNWKDLARSLPKLLSSPKVLKKEEGIFKFFIFKLRMMSLEFSSIVGIGYMTAFIYPASFVTCNTKQLV